MKTIFCICLQPHLFFIHKRERFSQKYLTIAFQMVLNLMGVEGSLYTSPDHSAVEVSHRLYTRPVDALCFFLFFLDEAAAHVHCLSVPFRSSSQSSDSSKKQIMEIPSSHTATAAAGNGERHTGGGAAYTLRPSGDTVSTLNSTKFFNSHKPTKLNALTALIVHSDWLAGSIRLRPRGGWRSFEASELNSCLSVSPRIEPTLNIAVKNW